VWPEADCESYHGQAWCPLTKFDGGLQLLHEAEDDAADGVYSDYNIREMK